MKKNIGVFPQSEFIARKRLLKALEQIFYVQFVGRDTGDWQGLYGGIVFGNQESRRDNLGSPPVILFTDSRLTLEKKNKAFIDFNCDPCIDATMQGRSLWEYEAASFKKISIGEGDIVLASCNGTPIWIMRSSGNSTSYITSAPLLEVINDGRIRDHIVKGRFLALVALIHFIREITKNGNWQEPPFRANIMIDDPNFHALSYGSFYFPAVAKHIERNKYHMQIATVPIDGWMVRKYFPSFLKEKGNCYSIAIHGNNHFKAELFETVCIENSERILAQALRRTDSLEKKIGFHIDRIQVPPHGICSKESIMAMLHLGYEGICADRPPWINYSIKETLLIDWYPAELTYGCFPYITRFDMPVKEEDILLNIFLKKPLVLYFHYWDLKFSLDILSQTVALLNSFGPVKWLSMEAIFRSNYAIRRENSKLYIRMYSRNVILKAPQGIRELIVEAPFLYGDCTEQVINCNGKYCEFRYSPNQSSYVSESISINETEDKISIAMIYPKHRDAYSVPPPPMAIVAHYS